MKKSTKLLLQFEQTMIDSKVPNFFLRATGRKYSSKETCVNDIRRICALFWNEHIEFLLGITKKEK